MSSASPAPRILLLNQYFPPDIAATGRHASAVADALVKRGCHVVVVAAQPSYTETEIAAPATEHGTSLEVHRVSMGRKVGRRRLATRVAGYLRYLIGAYRLSRRLAATHPFQGVLAFHNPPFIGHVAARVARRTGARFVYAPHDIHPEVLTATGFFWLPPPVRWACQHLSRRLVRAADAVVALGDGMRRTLIEEKGAQPERVAVVPIWAEPELEPTDGDAELRSRFVEHGLLILYMGNMGVMHPLAAVIEAAPRLESEGLAHFLFVGGGVRREQWKVAAAGAANVTFLGYQEGDALRRLIGSCDIGLVTLSDGMERLAVPSRASTLLSAGKPLLTVMHPDADIASLIEAEGCGWNVRDAGELETVVRRLVAHPPELSAASRAARRVFETRYRREKLADRYADLLLNQ